MDERNCDACADSGEIGGADCANCRDFRAMLAASAIAGGGEWGDVLQCAAQQGRTLADLAALISEAATDTGIDLAGISPEEIASVLLADAALIRASVARRRV